MSTFTVKLPPISLFILNENVLAVFSTAAHMNQKCSQLALSLLLTHREQKCTDWVWPEQLSLSQVNPLRKKKKIFFSLRQLSSHILNGELSMKLEATVNH